MVFEINGKIALITGGAAGIGFHHAKELLRNGAQGVCLADVNSTCGANALKEIETEFGTNKAIFVQTDITDKKQFDAAFQETVAKFNHIDIVINNAAILNDKIWEQEINININGTVNGILLAIEKYFPKYKQGPEAVIVNMASTAAWDFYPHIPVYSATKAAIVGLTKSWGVPHFYDKMQVRFVAVCPGVTNTPLTLDSIGKNLGEIYDEYLSMSFSKGVWPSQNPDYVAKEAANIIKYAPNGSVWVIEGGEPAYKVIPVDRQTQKKNLLKTE